MNERPSAAHLVFPLHPVVVPSLDNCPIYTHNSHNFPRNLGDLENLLRNTSIQAESIRGLGAFHGGLFMAASKVLGEETIAGSAQQGQGQGNRTVERKDDSDSE
ncbi:hypothetical protein DID88_005488 [Monilinia fructigena]|uniref:Uncharacterized protein n=1 Tax=Monilinia fructigena TaxID=38457 RepID=A0A395IZY2_9HELO|nr:hypothetical protein DID88_005488 [Monilinia fructigena]